MDKGERLTLPNFETYCKATVIKAVVFVCKTQLSINKDTYKSVEQTDAYIYSKFIFNKGAKAIQQGKYGIFQKFCRKKGDSQEGKLTLTSYDTQNLTQNTALNENVKTIRLLEENTGEIRLERCLIQDTKSTNYKRKNP